MNTTLKIDMFLNRCLVKYEYQTNIETQDFLRGYISHTYFV